MKKRAQARFFMGVRPISSQRRQAFQIPPRPYEDRRRLVLAGSQAQRAGQRDHRAVVGAELQARERGAEAFALARLRELRAQAAVGADAAGDDERLRAGRGKRAAALDDERFDDRLLERAGDVGLGLRALVARLPGEQHLQEGDMVLIDTGCRVQAYHSDITRSYVFGTPSAEQRRIWDLEHEAQAAAFDAARPGEPCQVVDDAARAVLAKAGLGPDYQLPGLPHRTGHGIGLAIHEAPYLVRGERTALAPGMCFSNEPMIVLPDQFGVRLEDHFHMTGTGAAWFTRPSPSIDAPFG